MNVDTYHRIASRIPDSSDRWATAIDLATDKYLLWPDRIDFVYECMRDEIHHYGEVEDANHVFLAMSAGLNTHSPNNEQIATALAALFGEPVTYDNATCAHVSESGWVIDLYRHDPYMVTPAGQCVLRFTDSPNRFPAWIKALVAMWKVPA